MQVQSSNKQVRTKAAEKLLNTRSGPPKPNVLSLARLAKNQVKTQKVGRNLDTVKTPRGTK